jgi:ABC-type branched-subunit amino acid transport system permease subunit
MRPPSAAALRAHRPTAVAVALLAVVPVVAGGSRTWMGLATDVLVAAGYAVGLNVLLGVSGQLFLCLGALAGVGGYGTALLADRAGVPVLAALAASTVAASALGALASWVAGRRRLDPVLTGIVTLTAALAFEQVLLGQRAVTGGETGLAVRAAGASPLGGRVGGYLALLGVLAACLVAFRAVDRSAAGWALQALRDDEQTAELAGVSVARHRIAAGAAGAAVVGLVGGLHGLADGFVSPSAYAFAHVDVRTLVVLALGGVGTVLGPVVGAVGLGVVDELLRDVGRLRTAVHGVVLVALFLRFGDGVVPAAARAARRFGGVRRRRRPPGDP